MLLKKYLWQPGCLASTKKKVSDYYYIIVSTPLHICLHFGQRIERVAQLARYVGGAVAKIFK